MHITNRAVGRAAAQGKQLSAQNFKCQAFLTGTGYLPENLRRILNERYYLGHVSLIVYSYATPIAWLDGDVWINPLVTYSITTSAKHQTELYRLPNLRRIPADAGKEEYLSVVEGHSVFMPGRKYGTYRAAS